MAQEKATQGGEEPPRRILFAPLPGSNEFLVFTYDASPRELWNEAMLLMADLGSRACVAVAVSPGRLFCFAGDKVDLAAFQRRYYMSPGPTQLYCKQLGLVEPWQAVRDEGLLSEARELYGAGRLRTWTCYVFNERRLLQWGRPENN